MMKAMALMVMVELDDEGGDTVNGEDDKKLRRQIKKCLVTAHYKAPAGHPKRPSLGLHVIYKI